MIKIRRLLVAVVIAAGMMGWRQDRVHQKLREDYQSRARIYGRMGKMARLGASLSLEQWLEECREIDRRNREGPFETTGRLRVVLIYPDSPEVERHRAEACRRLSIMYEQAARCPWLPIESEDDTFFWDTAIVNQ